MNTLEQTPKSFVHWPEFAQDRYLERIAIAREANRIGDKDPTPPEILKMATAQAVAEMSLASDL